MPPPDVRVCFVGDSFVNGTGDVDCLGWTGRVCATVSRAGLAMTYYNLGVRRETSADIAARWAAEIGARLPDPTTGRLVFSFGVNDTTRTPDGQRVCTSATLANLRDILGQAAPRFGTLMVGPPPVSDANQNTAIASLSEAFAEVCRAADVPYLDVCAPLLQSKIWLAEVTAGDGAHPSTGGYTELARLVEAWPAWRSWWAAPDPTS